MRRLLLTASALLLAACSSSHTGDCAEPTTCYAPSPSGFPDCCRDTAMEVCGECPAGTQPADACDRIDPICEEPPFDAGPTACTGPTPLCYAGWSGSPACCLEPGTAASCVGGSWQCPSGRYLASACGRIDPICESADGGPGPGLYDDCTVTSDCTLVGRSCCDPCGRPELEQVAAASTDRTSDYYLDVACPEARDEPPICPECASMPNPHLVATCDQTGFRPACAAVDLSTPAYASCTIDDDCVLAAPECCPCGDISPYETIAVRADADLGAVLCDEPGFACPPCAPIFDDGVTARCDAGACVVDIAP